jgi:NhaA family Na+:H+ antiporter
MFWGIVLGLVGGKFLGVGLFPYVLGKIKPNILPDSTKPIDFIPLGLLSGMGFTMSIFIAELAFTANDELLAISKLGILLSSLICGILSLIFLYLVFGHREA